jgi:hypothetical protein
MPIGKNAIKRVSNSGYSNVKTSAPDMENSEIAKEKTTAVSAKKQTVTKKADTSLKKPTVQAKKPTQKKASAPKKSLETEPSLNPVNVAKTVVSEPVRRGDGYINLGGGDLPYYLL